MLAGLRLWHVALKRSPYRESRLLAFAGGFSNPNAPGQAADPTLNPGETANAEGAEKPKESTSVQDAQSAERNRVHDALATPEEPTGDHADTEKKPTVDKALLGVSATLQKLREVEKSMAAVDKKAKALMGADHYRKFQEDRKFIKKGLGDFEQMRVVLDTVKRWNQLEVLPSELRVALETFGTGSIEFDGKEGWHKNVQQAHANLAPRFANAGDMNRLAYAHLSKSLPVSETNASTQITAQQEARRVVDEYSQAIDLPRIIETLLEQITEETALMEQCLGSADTMNVIAKLSEAKEEEASPAAAGAPSKGILRSIKDAIPLELVSIADVIDAGKQVIEAYKEAWEQRRRLRASGTAHKLSKFVKHFYLGEDVEQTLKRNIESKNNEMKESYVSYLKSSDSTFKELFDPGAIFDSNQGDYNRCRAVIEYAATKGWLYEIEYDPSSEKATVMGRTLEVGKNLPPETNLTQYMRYLNEQNGNGEDAEVKRGEGLVGTDEKIPPILVQLKEQMSLQNYWAVKGICQVALNKAKAGHTSSWLAVTIYRELRNDPMARRYVSKRLYDQIKNLVLPMPMIGVAVVMDREPLVAWQQSNPSNETAERNLAKAGLGGETIASIESEILEQQRLSGNPPMSTDDLDDLVAKVMAAQVIRLPGWKKAVTIFSDKYQNYRNFAQGFDAENASSADPDYYDPTMGSEVLILGRKAVLNLLSIKSTRDFDLGTRAYSYLAQVCVRHDQLAALLPGSKELETYRNHVQENMAAVFLEKFDINDTSQLANVKIAIPQLKPDGSIGGGTHGQNYAFVEFYKRGLLTRNFLIQAHKDGGGGLKKLIESIFMRADGSLPSDIQSEKPKNKAA